MQAGGCGFEPRYLHQNIQETMDLRSVDTSWVLVAYSAPDDMASTAMHRSLIIEYETLGIHSLKHLRKIRSSY